MEDKMHIALQKLSENEYIVPLWSIQKDLLHNKWIVFHNTLGNTNHYCFNTLKDVEFFINNPNLLLWDDPKYDADLLK
jgi:hypothetical protein